MPVTSVIPSLFLTFLTSNDLCYFWLFSFFLSGPHFYLDKFKDWQGSNFNLLIQALHIHKLSFILWLSRLPLGSSINSLGRKESTRPITAAAHEQHEFCQSDSPPPCQ